MCFHKQTYYLSLRAPSRGERIVAKIVTDDKVLAEHLFGCGNADDNGFSFGRLFTEEEAKHMFRPGSSIPGTYDMSTGESEKYKDYTKSPLFRVEDGVAYRIKGSSVLQLDLRKDRNDFAYVNGVLSGKIQPVGKVSQKLDNETYLSKNSTEPKKDFASVFDFVNVRFDDEPEFEVDPENQSVDLDMNNASVYYDLNTQRDSNNTNVEGAYTTDIDIYVQSAHFKAMAKLQDSMMRLRGIFDNLSTTIR